MSWEEFFEQRVKPHSDKLDAWDITILNYTHISITKKLQFYSSKFATVDLSNVKREVHHEIGFISDEDLSKRLKKLEDLNLIIRSIRLN